MMRRNCKSSKYPDGRQPQQASRSPVEQQPATSPQEQQHMHHNQQRRPGGGNGCASTIGIALSGSSAEGGKSSAVSSQPNAPQLLQQQQQQQNTPSSSTSASTDAAAGSGHISLGSRLSQQFQKRHLERLEKLSQLETQQQQPAESSPHDFPPANQPPDAHHLHHQQPTDPVLESYQFAESVSRSQSHRYPQANPLHHQESYGPHSTSLEDIPRSLLHHQQLVQSFVLSPLMPQQGTQEPTPPQASPHLQHRQLHPLPEQAPPPHPLRQHQHQHQHQQPPPQQQQQQNQSGARKLLKSLISRSGGHRSSAEHSAHNNTGGIGRRPSTRKPHHPTSPLSSSLRTGPSHVSLEQSGDWPLAEQQPVTQPSPLQPVGGFAADARFSLDLSSQELLVQQQQQQQQQQQTHQLRDQYSTIRTVSADQEQQYQDDQAQYSLQGQQQQGYPPPELRRYSSYGHPGSGEQSEIPEQLLQQFQVSPQTHCQQQPPTGTQPQFVGQIGPAQVQSPETVSQLSHESPITDPDQRSTGNNNPPSAQASPAVAYSQDAQEVSLQAHQQVTPPAQQPEQLDKQQQTMPSTQGGPRRGDMEESMSHGPPPAYRQHNRPPGNNMNPLSSAPVPAGSQNPSFRPDQRFPQSDDQQPQQAQTSQQGQQQQQQSSSHRTGEHGRNSPQPLGSESSLAEKEMKELVTKYKNVKRLYFDGKNTIDQLTCQVEQLQNAIANQRISQSRTKLDDSEYIKLFDRLNGAINNLSFNIRKDWQALPSWIERYVSPDALKTGRQEMTAVGRAVVAYWVIEEVFNKCFHPALDPTLSSSLKEIELNIRRFSYTMNMQEEHNALTTKIVSWRMATLEGLDRKINSPSAGDNYSAFCTMVTSNLTAYLCQFLVEPRPPGIEGSVSMISELAVKIASSIPMESRDVAVMYPMPESTVHKDLMEVEKTPLPALEAGDADDSGSIAEEGKDKQSRSKPGTSNKTKFGTGTGRKGSTASSIMQAPADTPSSSAGPPPRDPNKVRIAGFVAVEVRGKHPLVKAPVWTLG